MRCTFFQCDCSKPFSLSPTRCSILLRLCVCVWQVLCTSQLWPNYYSTMGWNLINGTLLSESWTHTRIGANGDAKIKIERMNERKDKCCVHKIIYAICLMWCVLGKHCFQIAIVCARRRPHKSTVTFIEFQWAEVVFGFWHCLPIQLAILFDLPNPELVKWNLNGNDGKETTQTVRLRMSVGVLIVTWFTTDRSQHNNRCKHLHLSVYFRMAERKKKTKEQQHKRTHTHIDVNASVINMLINSQRDHLLIYVEMGIPFIFVLLFVKIVKLQHKNLFRRIRWFWWKIN